MADAKKTTDDAPAIPTFKGDHYIYSTLSNDQRYTLWQEKAADGAPNIALGSVLVHGRANVINEKTLDTPKGVMTRVTADQLSLLHHSGSFLRHKKAGYLTIEKAKVEPDKVAKDMTPKDKSAQLEKADFKKPPSKAASKG